MIFPNKGIHAVWIICACVMCTLSTGTNSSSSSAEVQDSSGGTVSGQKAWEKDSIATPRNQTGISQLSVQTLLWCLHSPCVLSHAAVDICMHIINSKLTEILHTLVGMGNTAAALPCWEEQAVKNKANVTKRQDTGTKKKREEKSVLLSCPILLKYVCLVLYPAKVSPISSKRVLKYLKKKKNLYKNWDQKLSLFLKGWVNKSVLHEQDMDRYIPTELSAGNEKFLWCNGHFDI